MLETSNNRIIGVWYNAIETPYSQVVSSWIIWLVEIIKNSVCYDYMFRYSLDASRKPKPRIKVSNGFSFMFCS